MFAFLQCLPLFFIFMGLFSSIQIICYKNIQDTRLAKLVWQLPCHILCAITGLVASSSDDVNSFTISDFNSISLRPYCFYYAYWFIVCFDFYKNRNLKDIDHNMMLFHHTATLIAIFSSDYLGYRKIGLYILMLHDCSDVWIMILKLFFKLKVSEAGMIWAYLMTVAIWIYTRVYLFVYILCYSTIWPYLLANPKPYDLIPSGMLFVLCICNLIWTIKLLKLPFSKKVVETYEQTKNFIKKDFHTFENQLIHEHS